MHDNAAAALQYAMQLSGERSPCVHGVVCGGVQIPDWKVEPVDAAQLHRLAELWHAQHLEFVVLDQAQDGVGTPSLDRVHVEIKVPIPRGAKDTVAFLAWAKGQTELTVANWQAVDAKGVGYAVTKQALYFLCRFELKLLLGCVTFGRIRNWVTRSCQELRLNLIAPPHQIPFHFLTASSAETDHQ